MVGCIIIHTPSRILDRKFLKLSNVVYMLSHLLYIEIILIANHKYSLIPIDWTAGQQVIQIFRPDGQQKSLHPYTWIKVARIFIQNLKQKNIPLLPLEVNSVKIWSAVGDFVILSEYYPTVLIWYQHVPLLIFCLLSFVHSPELIIGMSYSH